LGTQSVRGVGWILGLRRRLFKLSLNALSNFGARLRCLFLSGNDRRISTLARIAPTTLARGPYSTESSGPRQMKANRRMVGR
jgi:hypothetical protein